MISCVSISCRKVPVRILENFTFRNVTEALFDLKKVDGVSECVILQTCHRVELYVYSLGQFNPDALSTFLCKKSSSAYSAKEYIDVYSEGDTARHLFRVASGLESILLGENEILHQVTDALNLACNTGTVGPILRLLFESAIQAGGKIRRETAICRGTESIGNLTVKIARSKLKSFDNRTVAIIGAGKIGCIVAKAVAKEKTRTVLVANRTFARAKKLAEMLSGYAVNFDKLEEVLAQSDVAVCTTSAPHRIISAFNVTSAIELKKREGKKENILIIDASNPRAVDPLVKQINGVELIDLDELVSQAKHNRRAKESAIRLAENLIETDVKNVFKRFESVPHDHLISDFMKWCEEKRLKNLERALRETELNERQKELIHNLSYSLMHDLMIPFIKPLRESEDHATHATVLSNILKEVCANGQNNAQPVETVCRSKKPRS